MVRRSRLLVATALVISSGLHLGAAPAAASSPPGIRTPGEVTVDPAVTADQATTKRFVVVFAAQANLADAARIDDFRARGKEVIDKLQATATSTQRDALALVDRLGGRATSYWVRNTMVVDGTQQLADALASLGGVAEVRQERIYPLIEPVKPDDITLAAAEPEWNIAKIGADAAWE